MSLEAAKQFYSEIDKLADKSPGLFIDEGMIPIYDALRKAAVEADPDNAILAAIPVVHSQTRYAAVRSAVGQIVVVFEAVKAKSKTRTVPARTGLV